MKQDTNFSAAWKQVVGSRTTATRQTKQSILNSMLRAFLFLTLMVMGANVAWAQTSYDKAEISGAPGASTGWQTIKDQGDVKAWYNGTTTEFTNGAKEIDSKWFVKLSSDGFIKIRVAKGSVVAGDILRVELADIYQNADNQDLGFKVEGSGSTPSIKETDNAIHTIDYTLKAGDIRVDPDNNNYDYIQINRNGQYGFNGCGYHSVEILRNILDASIFKTWSAIDGNTSTGTAGCADLGTSVDAGGTVFGDGNVYYLNYVNVKGGRGAIMPDAKCLIIEGNSGVAVRILFNRISDGGSNEEIIRTIPSTGKLIIDISNYDTFHLNAIKIPWNDSKGNVVNTIKFSNALTTYTVNVNRTDLPENCDAWFTIGSDPQQYRTAQQVPVGTSVTFTMSSSNEKYVPGGWRTEPWQSHDRGWMGYTASFTTTVRENAEVDDFTGCDHDYSKHEKYVHGNINAAPEFKKTFKVIARAEQGGTATVSDANTHDMSIPYSSPTGTLTFTAAPEDGYTFDAWYNNSGTSVSYSNPYSYGSYSSGDGVDLILTAKFKSTEVTHPAITCVNNTIDKTKINTKNCTFNAATGQGSMTTNGAYLSIKFEGEMNLGDVTNFQIDGTNVTKQGNDNYVLDEVLFICTDGDVSKSWEPSNCSFTIDDDQSVKLRKTKEIRIKNNSRTGSFTISAIKFVFGGTHIKLSTPVLNNGTTAEMVVRAGRPFTLSATNGYWREYKSDLSGEKPDGHISGVWAPTHEFTSGLSEGDYYFGIQDNDNKTCGFGVNHHSDVTTVHVRVIAPLLTIGKPECNHFGSRTHGDNYFDIQRLNPLNGVTIGVADDGEGRKINVPTNGGAVEYVFDNAYNLACLVGWTISNNKDLRGRVSAVEFFTDEECTPGQRVADFWTGAGERSGINDSRLNNQIKAIRIGFNSGDAASYDINWICFKFEHRENQLPTLTEGTTADMVIYTDETLKITNTPGYWRQFTDGNYTEETGDLIGGCAQIPTDAYKSTYTFEHMKNGDYYFGARDAAWCSLGYDHGDTELVPIHVQVTNPPTELKVVYDLNGGEGAAPVDPNTYNYKDNAAILAPGSITKDGHFFSHWSLTPDDSGDKYSKDAEKGSTTVVVNKKELRLYAIWEKLGFKGWFNFENRLIAQWNFDLSDEVRLNLPTLKKNTAYWSETIQDARHIYYTYVGGALNYNELTYDGTNVIPMAAGLKFKASGTGTEIVKILVTKDGTGKIENVQFCLDDGVKLDIPYVRNSYRNDKGSAYAPYQWDGPNEAPTWNYFDPGDAYSNEGFIHFQDCLHHLNRDIVYVVSDPDILTYGDGRPITNLCADGTNTTLELFNNGGDENVKGLPDGVHKTWRKCNFTGTQGDRCIIEFSKPIKIDRIAVNRNLVYSFYTENTAVTTDGKYDKPFPGMRLVGSPQGQRVANVGGTWTEYSNAIAATFGGWRYNDNEYKDAANVSKTDLWADLNVYQGKHAQINGGAELEGNRDYSVDYSKIDISKVPFATDGFPVYSREATFALSETVNPSATAAMYHDQSDGWFLLHESDGGSNEKPYLPNFNPWTLPSRGAYVKFEPTLPGVLNVDVLQEGGATYYISDEFGRLIKDNVYTKVGQTYQKIDGTGADAGHFSVAEKSYVKYSFNVYPGKSYYLFSNDGGMGVSGFYFEPYVYRKYNTKPSTTYAEEDFELSRINVGIKTAEMTGGPTFTWTDYTSDAMDYTNQAAHTGVSVLVNPTDEKNVRNENHSVNLNPQSGQFDAIAKNTNPHIVDNVNDINYVTLDNKAVHVTYTRDFKANTWSTICLPYSMNNLQLETVFGEGTKVVLLRDVQDKGRNGYECVTANFIYHVNQDIIAGYPYLIYPKKDVSSVTTNAYLDVYEANINGEWASAPDILTINSVGPNTVTYNGANYGGLACYDFKGNYKNEDLPAGSYVVAKSDGKLTRLPAQQTAAPFRAFLKYDQSKEADGAFHSRPRYIESVNFGELSYELGEIDGIEDILLDSGIVGAKADVYSINGLKVRQHTDNLQGLKKGMYIVNGRKYIVR